MTAPSSVSELLAANTEMTAAIQRVRGLHWKLGTDGTGYVCGECTDGADGYGQADHVPYPCPTISALDGGTS